MRHLRVEAGAREALIHTALELFAARGLSDVSVREIIKASGQGNQSAVNYYFSDKDGLIEAVAAHVNARFQPYLAEALIELGALKRQDRLRAEDLVAALGMPMINFYHGDAHGKVAIRFIARLTWEYGDRGQALINREAGPFLVRIERHLAKALPGKSREKIRLQMLMSANAMLVGLASLGNLRHSPFHKDGETLYRGKGDLAIRHSIDFVCRGLLGD